MKTLKLQLFVEWVVVFCYNGDVLILAVWSIFFQAGVVFILWLALMLMIVAYIVVVMKITLTSEVEEHFAIFPDQKRILDEIVEKVPFYFPDANLQCEFVGDDLCVNILTTKSVDEASKALDRFDNEWWLDKWANSPICVCLDFVCV